MYMAPVVRVPAPVSASPGLRATAGAPVMIAAVAVMLVWLAVIAGVTGIVLTMKLAAALPRLIVQGSDYAGRIALNR